MIDTIRLAYLADSKLIKIVNERSDKLIKVSLNGEVLWQKGFMKDDLPSHFGGLRIAHIEQSALIQQGFKNARDLIQFEFSLQKWQSETGYNNRNTTLEHDLFIIPDWVYVLSKELDYDFVLDLFELYRVDMAQNWLLQGVTSVIEFMECLKVKFSQHEKSGRPQTYDGTIFYGSSWISKKMYWKHKEFQDIERKKKPHLYRIKEEGASQFNFKEFKKQKSETSVGADNLKGGVFMSDRVGFDGKRALNQEEIDGMLRMLRFELGYKRAYLERHKIIRIADIPNILAHFEEEKNKYLLSVKKIGPGLRLKPAEYMMLDLVKRYGVDGAKCEFLKERTSRTWERHKKSLVSKGIYLQSILKDDFQKDIEETDKQADFYLELAA